MTTATATMRRNRNFTRNKFELRSGPITASLMLVALVILLSLLYINQITKTSVFNYKISNLTNKRSELVAEKQKLQIEAARLQSLAEVKNNATASGMVKTDTVSFAQAN